ncbi:MAG: GNAT family N-acetyltransferase [Reyranella sp.]|nr:GNAT family N-acetyltransferase [Reyranella sp.]MBL6653669.1 GNAT family N-acetyltransferase [Reyranella sp.]
MASIETLDVRPIDAALCEAVWPLSVEAGWNQNLADWRFMLGAGRGFGCVGPDGRWQASSLVLPLGRKLAWISMVLVTKERRRGGVGTGLLKRCIEEVRSAGAVAGLDATEQGRPIYLPLGFHDLYAIARWHFDEARDEVAAPFGVTLRAIGAADLPRLALYDRPLTGMERPAVLAHLALRQPGRAWIAEDRAGGIVGYVLGREGRMATSLGPVVADSEAIALALISKAASAAPGPFIVDVPAAHGAVRSWLEKQGAVTPRGYMRMTLGDAKGLDDASHVFALAGPELG